MYYHLYITGGQGELSVSLGYKSSAKWTAVDLYKAMLVFVSGEQGRCQMC